MTMLTYFDNLGQYQVKYFPVYRMLTCEALSKINMSK